MPLYEYACASCGATFERLAKVSDRRTAQPCPNCSRAPARILSGDHHFSAPRVKTHQNVEARNAKAERLHLPSDKHPPKVDLNSPPPVPKRYIDHMLRHGGC